MFKQLIEEEWRKIGDGEFAGKLRTLKLSIKRWNTEVFGNIDTNLAKLEEEIACVEGSLENGVDEEVNVARHKASKSLIGRWYGRRTEYWRQLSWENVIKRHGQE